MHLLSHTKALIFHHKQLQVREAIDIPILVSTYVNPHSQKQTNNQSTTNVNQDREIDTID